MPIGPDPDAPVQIENSDPPIEVTYDSDLKVVMSALVELFNQLPSLLSLDEDEVDRSDFDWFIRIANELRSRMSKLD